MNDTEEHHREGNPLSATSSIFSFNQNFSSQKKQWIRKIVYCQDFDQLVALFKEHIQIYTLDEQKTLEKALEKAIQLHQHQYRQNDKPYIIHPIIVSLLLMSIQAGAPVICAGLLHDTLEDTTYTKEQLQNDFGQQVTKLVDGVTKIMDLQVNDKSERDRQTVMKVLFAMVEDINVILIKLADKIHNMVTLEFLPVERQRAIAKECCLIYAPIADRLGISQVKNLLEDLSLKVLDPKAYQYIQKTLKTRQKEQETYLERLQRKLLHKAIEYNISIYVDYRVKHIYSIYNKIKKKGKEIHEIYDLLALRVYCHTTAECYTILGLIHRLFKPLEGRFKDYIAMPKSNGYQSLHTTVVSDGYFLEFQIRTEQMHVLAEYGVAAHWLYKEKLQWDPQQLQFVNSIRSIKLNEDSSQDSLEFFQNLRGEFLKDSVYVFTPKGSVFEFPLGATAIDFAYQVHTDIGEHCCGAKADGRIIALNTPLKNGQVVQISTSDKAHPRLSWLKVAKTGKARHKIRQWLNKNQKEFIIENSILLSKKEWSESILSPHSEPKNHAKGGKDKSGLGKDNEAKNIGENDSRHEDTTHQSNSIMVLDEQEQSNIQVNFAHCCHPHLGTPIVGFVSRSKGLTIHTKTCPNLVALDQQRLINVAWQQEYQHYHKLVVTTTASLQAFHDLDHYINHNTTMNLVKTSIEKDTVRQQNMIYCQLVSTRPINPFLWKVTIEKIKKIPGIIDVERV